MANSTKLLTIAILSVASQVHAQAMFFTPTQSASPGARVNRSVTSLPETDALKSELESARRNLSDLAARLDRIHTTTRSTRKKAELVSSMIKEIKTIENQISRIKRELKSFSKIPYFSMLKPVVAGLDRLNDKVAAIRKQADKVRRDIIDPSIKKMKTFESDVKATSQSVKQAQSDTSRSLTHLVYLRTRVADRGYKFAEVNILESTSRTTRIPVRKVLPILQMVNSSTANAERKLNTYASSLSSVTALRPGITQLKSKLSPLDKKARDIAKVLGRRLKLPFGKSISIRNVLEAPGNLADVILKPLLKIAKKALKPLTDKMKFDLKAPKQFVQIQERLKGLKAPTAELSSLQRQLQQLRNVELKQLSGAVRTLKATSVGRSATPQTSPTRVPIGVVWGS